MYFTKVNIKSIPLKISLHLREYLLVHKFLREIYCIFFPGIRALVTRAFKKYTNIFVLKIGAMDGICADPLANFLLMDERVAGILVEPLPKYVEQLNLNFGKTGRFVIEQVAISDFDGVIEFYFFDNSKIPLDVANSVPWYIGGLSSLNRNHLEQHLNPKLHKWISSIQVKAMSVKTMLEKNKISKIDLLVIDTEGYDYVILKQIDFSYIHPKIVIFEKKHLKNNEASEAKKRMQNYGYIVLEKEDDFFCISKL